MRPDSLIGQTITHYRILARLGEGGMGVVYLAEDLTLKRRVALKFLPVTATADPEARARLTHEAQAAAALLHPNICPVYEIAEADGQSFIAMAHLEGKTLRQRLSEGPVALGEAVSIARQLADGLAAAHGKGIVHRDVKPANVMLLPDGRAVLMDFGLARVGGATRLTRSGSTVGTVAYMSPEQARGEVADSRSDAWGLGVVLYELVAGRVPFGGESEAAQLYAILNVEPAALTEAAPGIPAGLNGIVTKALAKEPAHRYPSAAELAADLQALEWDVTAEPAGKGRRTRRQRAWLTMAMLFGAVALLVGLTALNVGGLRERLFEGGPRIRSLAVLPLVNLSGDPGQEYFADGMTAALINDLCKVNALRTVSQTSVMRFKGSKRSLPEIAHELHVDAVVEGAVQRAGARLHINAQLIRAAGERQLWADSYDRDARDVLVLQSEIARAIAGAVRVHLTPQDQARLTHARRVVPQAYDEYLKGQQSLLQGWQSSTSLEHFRRAIVFDSAFAAAHAGLSLGHAYRATAEGTPGEDGPIAMMEAAEALRLGDNLALAHTANAVARLHFAWDWAGAEREFRRALDLNPNDPLTLDNWRFYLTCTGRCDEALAAGRRAYRGEMDTPGALLAMAWSRVYCGRYEEAVADWQRYLQLEPSSVFATAFLAVTYVQLGRPLEAAALIDSLAARGQERVNPSLTAWVYGRAGRREEARRMVDWMLEDERRRVMDPYSVAIAYDGLGDKERTLRWLEKAVPVCTVSMVQVGIELWGDEVRADPRFDAILRRVGWPGRRG